MTRRRDTATSTGLLCVQAPGIKRDALFSTTCFFGVQVSCPVTCPVMVSTDR